MTLGSKITRMLAVGALAASSIMAGTTAAQADAPSYYPSGIQQDVPISTITGGGWQLCYQGDYATSDTLTAILNSCDGDYILLAAGPANADTYTLAAAGTRSAVFNPTGQNETTLENGTYFYFNVSASMGFSPSSTISQGSADVYGIWGGDPSDSHLRVSWHLDACYDWESNCVPSGQPGYIEGGWRVGDIGELNDSTDYVRAIYTKSVPRPPVLVVDALNVNVAMGEVVPASVRVLGLRGTDSVSDVVLEYEGSNIWGEHYGPSTTAPTQAGTYAVSVKSYKLTATDASIYFQAKHGAQLIIRWKPLPITDPKLAAPATNADPAGSTTYGDNGATVTGADWSLLVSGAPRASIGGFLIADGGTVLRVSGTGYRPWSPVRIWFMSDPVELGKVYTDASGAFSADVTLPSATGNHTLQVNGYGKTGLVRSSNVALFVGTTRSLSDKFLFAKNSSALSSDAVAKVAKMMNSIPVKPWRIHITLTTSALSLTGANARITQERVDNIANRLSASLKAAGVDVVVESTIWYQPGLAPRWEKQARWVHVDLNW